MIDVWTARISYSGRDRLDVSRKGNDPVGVLFAPSWTLVHPFLEQRRAGFALTEAGWQRYVDDYTAEMRASYRAHRTIWDEVLARESVTLACFCTDATKCHRTVLASLFRSLGANVCGERPRSLGTDHGNAIGNLRGIG